MPAPSTDMTTMSPPRSQVTGTLTRTNPALPGSLVGCPTAVIAPTLEISVAQFTRSVSADTTACSRGANSASMSTKRPSRADRTTVAATSAGSVPTVIPHPYLLGFCER
jgi:hypothetical protein